MDVSGQALSIMKELSDFAASGAAEGFANVGIGVASVFLLVVTIYYLTSLLDGGKFQLKMLVPVLVFMVVCHFSWVSTPVVSFVNTLSRSLVDACDDTKEGILAERGCPETANINDMNNRLLDKGMDGEVDAMIGRREDAGGEGGWLAGKVKKGGIMTVNQLSYDFQNDNRGDSAEEVKPSNLTGQGLISNIVSFVCDIMSYVLRAFGGMMAALVVAFGPVTFAFAILPGQAGTIKSWFIRLCQFSLYAPLCALIDCFSVKIFVLMHDTAGVGSFLMCIAVAVCNLVALTSVPTIASMIIEGAQGAVSLSQGLQTIGGALSGGLTAGGGIATGIAGRDNVQRLKDAAGGVANSGLVGLGKLRNGKSGFGGFMKRAQASGRSSRLNRK